MGADGERTLAAPRVICRKFLVSQFHRGPVISGLPNLWAGDADRHREHIEISPRLSAGERLGAHL
jgi:hypothetical protein